MHFLHYSVDTVFIMLGQRCNFSCAYCLQKPLRQELLADRSIHPDAMEFLRTLAQRQQSPLHIRFYGGEPFVYTEAMRAIVHSVRGEPNVFFSTICNGSLLDRDTADWCNEVGMAVTVSWDGPGSVHTRGRDVFADAAQRDILFSLNRLGISAVISPYAYPLEVLEAFAALDREYRDIHGYNMMLNLDEIMDTGLADKSLLAVDAARVRAEMEVMAGECEKALRGEEHDPWKANYAYSYVHALKNNVHCAKGVERGICACGNGTSTLNMDLQGNLYACHNTDRRVGTMRDPFPRYLSQVMLQDPTRENSRVCKDCPVVALCGCGCPLLDAETRKAGYCDLKRAMYQPIMDMVLRIGNTPPAAPRA